MDSFLKKSLCLILIISLSVVSSSCMFNEHINSRDLQNVAEKWMECIKNKDAEALFENFSQNIKDNRSEKTMDEIHQLLNYIDGDILSYKYHSGGMEEGKDKGHIYYYSFSPTFYEVKTDSDETYTIHFACHYIYDEKPEHEGLEKITIYKGDDKENKLTIGDWYIPD